MESGEFPMSPEIITREQKKDTHLKKVMKNVNTSGKASAHIPQLPLGDNSSPWGHTAICV
jgi:hypothetical protein